MAATIERNGSALAPRSPCDADVLTLDEGWRLLDERARRYLHMGGREFLARWRAGVFATDGDRPEVMRVAMLLPLVGEPAAAA